LREKKKRTSNERRVKGVEKQGGGRRGGRKKIWEGVERTQGEKELVEKGEDRAKGRRTECYSFRGKTSRNQKKKPLWKKRGNPIRENRKEKKNHLDGEKGKGLARKLRALDLGKENGGSLGEGALRGGKELRARLIERGEGG